LEKANEFLSRTLSKSFRRFVILAAPPWQKVIKPSFHPVLGTDTLQPLLAGPKLQLHPREEIGLEAMDKYRGGEIRIQSSIHNEPPM